MSSRYFIQNSGCKSANSHLFRFSLETPTGEVFDYDLLAILEKQDAEQLQVFKAKCDKAVVAESKAVQEMEVKSLEAEKVRLEEKKAAKQNTSKKQKAMHLVSAAEKKYQKLMEKVAKIQETVEKVRNIASATFKMPDFKFGAVTNAFGASYEELDVSSSSIEMTEESSSSNDLVSSSSVVELVNSSSSLEALEESSSSSYFKSSWKNLNKSIQYDTIIDSRDNQIYKILTIGEQTWMAENLNYYDTIQTPELKQHSWCFKNNESNCELYGRLYDLSVTIVYDPSEPPFAQLILQSKMDSNNVQGICLDRFRIPTISDYEKITDSYSEARYLISEKDNTSGFSIPVNSNIGFRNATKFVDKEVRFWTTTYHWGSYDYTDVVDFKLSSYMYGIGTVPEFGHNIRCIKK